MVFRLHYVATASLLTICSMLVSSREHFGAPIDCLVEGIPSSLMNTFCWLQSTYTVTASKNPFSRAAYTEQSKYHILFLSNYVTLCQYILNSNLLIASWYCVGSFTRKYNFNLIEVYFFTQGRTLPTISGFPSPWSCKQQLSSCHDWSGREQRVEEFLAFCVDWR
jgi:hypothetical protein